MKAEMSASGVLVVSPETPLEAYALKKWVYEATVHEKDEHESLIRGSMFIVEIRMPHTEAA